MAEPFVYDTGAKKFILGGGVDDVGNNIPRFEFKKERFLGKMADKTGKELDAVLMADPKLKEKYKTSQELYNDLQKYNASLDNPAPVETPVMDIPVNKNKNVTNDTIAKSDNIIGNYLNKYMTNKDKGLRFLYPIAEGFSPKATTYATSLFGSPVNKSVLSAIGGLASGLSADDKRADIGEPTKALTSNKKADTIFKINSISTKVSKDYITARNAWQEFAALIDEAKNEKNPSAQYALIKKFEKSLDPSSVVREGEFNMAMDTAGLVQKIINTIGQLERGTRISDEQIDNMAKIARKYYDISELNYKNAIPQVAQLGAAVGLSNEELLAAIMQVDTSKNIPELKITTKMDNTLPPENVKPKIEVPTTNEVPEIF